MKGVKCKVCGSPFVINKHFSLCLKHNNIRLNGNQNEPVKKTNKKNENNEFRERQRDEYGKLTCSGCGDRSDHHDVSHIIPVSIERKLENDDLNRDILCRSCHNIWEHKLEGVKKLLCYDLYLERIKQLSEFYFNRNFK